MSDLLERLGARAHRRGSPRLGVTVAGAGCALAVVGAVTIGGDHLGGGSGGGGGTQVPGVFLSAIVVLGGFLALRAVDSGPVATAGVVASSLGVPALMIFLTFDRHSTEPVSVNAILVVSALAWLISYAAGPGRGHSFYLGAGLVAGWLFVLNQVKPIITDVVLLPIFFTFRLSGEGSGAASFTTFGFFSLLIGTAYLIGTVTLDRRGYRGTATAGVFPALVALAVGVLAVADDLEEIGTGLLLIIIGTALAMAGAAVQRRFTTWIGGVAIFFGVAEILDKLAPDDATEVGAGAIVLGIALVIVAQVLVDRWHEPPDTDPGPSVYSSAGSSHPVDPPPEPAGSVLG